MIKCPNCGAEIENDIPKCPNCGYINIEGAQKEHQEKIDEIKDNIKKEKKKPVKAFFMGLSKGTRVILTTLGVLAAVVAILFCILLYELRDHPKEFFLTADDKARASVYKVIVEEQLNDAYDNRDIEQLAYLYDRAYSEDRVNIWGVNHYETGYAASCYLKLQKCMPNLDKKKLSKREAEEITYYCFYFYYKAYGEDGEVMFDSIREEEIIPIIHDRLGFSEEDMQSFSDQVFGPYGGVNRSAVYKATKSYFKNYH